jgi:transcriptional regulator with XRE-family HTH domain
VIREQPGLSQERVAREAGLDVRQISALVCGQSNPTYLTLLRLCRGLHISLGELMVRVEQLEADAAEGGRTPAVEER